MKRIKYVLFVLAMMFALTACGSKEEAVEDDESASAAVFGTFTTKTLDGEEVSEAIFSEADLTMVNIWGTYCGPCIAEMPHLGEISREYEGKGFQMIGLICDAYEPEDETALQIVEETQADYMHMLVSDDLITNVLQYVSAVPTTIFVNKEGKMVGEMQMGAKSKSQWETLIDNYLDGVQ